MVRIGELALQPVKAELVVSTGGVYLIADNRLFVARCNVNGPFEGVATFRTSPGRTHFADHFNHVTATPFSLTCECCGKTRFGPAPVRCCRASEAPRTLSVRPRFR